MSVQVSRAQLSTPQQIAELLGRLASQALVAEARLTPKPALVDSRGSGAHADLSLELLLKSAACLQKYFEEMARMSLAQSPSSELRRQLGECGRRAEAAMFEAANGSNAHRGAIWCLGLLVAASAMGKGAEYDAADIARRAGILARFSDCHTPETLSHGKLIQANFGLGGARAEAEAGFPHIINVALPMIRQRSESGHSDATCLLDAFLAIMCSLDDTCLVYRAGLPALKLAQDGAQLVLQLGGSSSAKGMASLFQLDRDLLELRASPGGSADLLAGSIFLYNLSSVGNIANISSACVTDASSFGE